MLPTVIAAAASLYTNMFTLGGRPSLQVWQRWLNLYIEANDGWLPSTSH